MGDRRLVILDGMRGLAAVAVLVFHVLGELGVANGLVDGSLAVDFFFSLSGFVLARAHGRQLRQGMLTAAGFLRLRLLRVGPMLMLGTLLGAALLPWEDSPYVPHGLLAAPAMLLSLLALPLPVGDRLYWINGAFWSLCAELVVNALFGLLFAARSLAWFAAAAVAATLAYVGIAIHHGVANVILQNVHGIPSPLCRAAASFFIGVGVERASRRFGRGLPLPGWVPPALLVLLFVNAVSGAAALAYALLRILLLFPMLIFLGAHARQADARGIWRLLGDASFPLYATHSPILLAAFTLVQRWPAADRGLAVTLVAAALIPLSALVTRRVDEPARRWLRHRRTPPAEGRAKARREGGQGLRRAISGASSGGRGA